MAGAGGAVQFTRHVNDGAQTSVLTVENVWFTHYSSMAAGGNSSLWPALSQTALPIVAAPTPIVEAKVGVAAFPANGVAAFPANGIAGPKKTYGDLETFIKLHNKEPSKKKKFQHCVERVREVERVVHKQINKLGPEGDLTREVDVLEQQLKKMMGNLLRSTLRMKQYGGLRFFRTRFHA